MIIHWTVSYAATFYLRMLLWLGQADYVCSLFSSWGGHGDGTSRTLGGKNNAIWDANEQLIKHYGYHKCPSCTWATKKKNEHLVAGSWCQEREDEKSGKLETGWDSKFYAYLQPQDF
jgi:hypothetical protein